MRRVLLAIVCVVSVSAAARAQAVNPLQLEAMYPRQALRGQTSIVSVAIARGNELKSVEIMPSAGVHVARITGSADANEQAIQWWDIAIDVAADAAPGDRAIVLTTPTGSAARAVLSIPTHAPAISNLVIVPSSASQPSGEIRMTVADAERDLGDAPYVWFTAACGGDPIAGALRSKVEGAIVRAALPELRGSCDVRAHITDGNGTESNELAAKATFATASGPKGPPLQSPGAGTAGPSAAISGGPSGTRRGGPSGPQAGRRGGPSGPLTAPPQDWNEFASQEDRFTINFPGQPVVTETLWASQYGAVLPVRIYSGADGSAKYSITVVDYNPLLRVLSERARTLPALDLAVHDYGIGYWRTDIRSAELFAASKFLERDGKVTTLVSNFADGVVGLQVNFVSNADQSRTFCAIYMHVNRLVIAEATLPRGYPAPFMFQQSLGWLDEKGDRVRYQRMNYNDPDAVTPVGGK